MTFEEGTHSAWLYDLLVRRVAKLVVCNPRKNALLKAGNKSDTVDARKLAELLRAGLLSPVYHGQNSTAAVKHLGRSYAALTEDTTRVMGRLKALYRSQAIACAGQKPYAARHREEWLAKLSDSGLQRRAQRLYQQLDLLQELRRDARHDLILECRKHRETKLLRTHSLAGSDTRRHAHRTSANAASLPHASGSSGPTAAWRWRRAAAPTFGFVNGQLERKKKPVFIRGLNLNHNHDLKNLFKSAATTASGSHGAFGQFYENLLTKGNEARAGSAHPGAQDRRHHFACLEERRTLRRRISEATSRLSAQIRKTRPDSLPP